MRSMRRLVLDALGDDEDVGKGGGHLIATATWISVGLRVPNMMNGVSKPLQSFSAYEMPASGPGGLLPVGGRYCDHNQVRISDAKRTVRHSCEFVKSIIRLRESCIVCQTHRPFRQSHKLADDVSD